MYESQMFFNNQDEFLDKIDEVSHNTHWETITVGDLATKVEGSTDGMFYHFEDEVKFLRDCSLRSLRQRLKSENDLVTRVSNGALEGSLTATDDSLLFENYIKWACEVLKQRKEDTGIVKVSISDDKANAFLSEEYVEYLDSAYVHESAFEAIQQMTGETDFSFEGWWDYAANIAEYVTKKTKTVNGKEYNTKIRVRTSDAGYSSIGVGLALCKGSKTIPMMSDINIAHRAAKSKDPTEVRAEFKANFNEALRQTDSVINEVIAKAEALSTVTLEHSAGAAKKIAKEIGLPKAEALAVIREKIDERKSINAWSLYETLCEIISNDWSIEKRIKQTGNLTKILGITRWGKYDTDFEWK